MDIEIIILILGVVYYIWYSIKKAAEEVKKNRPGQGGVPRKAEEESSPWEDAGEPADPHLPEPVITSRAPAEPRPQTRESRKEQAASTVYRGREVARNLREEVKSARKEIKDLRPEKPVHVRPTVRYPQKPLPEQVAYQVKTAAAHPYADFDLHDAVIKSIILERVTG